MDASFWTEADRRRAHWDVLEHPFYRRWSAGELTRGELAVYASEYDHAVVAIAEASRRAGRLRGGPLERCADEEERHTKLWRAFARATGWTCSRAWFYGEDPLPETERCARTWAGSADRGLAEHLVTLHEVESVQPRASRAKLDGLLRHYGFDEGPATEYFRLHATVDGERTALVRATLDQLLPDADADALLEQAEAVHRDHWKLLDGLEALVAA